MTTSTMCSLKPPLALELCQIRERVEILRKGAGIRRSSPFCTSTRVREQFGSSAGVSAFFSKLVPLRMLLYSSGLVSIRGTYLQYFTWYIRCLQCLQSSEISSLTREFVALYSYRVLQIAMGIVMQLDCSSNQQRRCGIQARGYPSFSLYPTCKD